ncbi:complement inhibitor SCIN family protein [Staphylococcus aureus]
MAAGSLNRYYKRTIMMNEYRAKAALKKNDFKSMAEAESLELRKHLQRN